MKNNIIKKEKNFIDETGNLAKRWGLGGPAGRVWATLLLSEPPLSQKEIAKKTGYSLSLVSPSLKLLENLNMIKLVRKENKKKLYTQVLSFVEAFNVIIKRFLQNDIQPLIKDLEHLKKFNNNPKISNLIKDYKQLETYLSWFEKTIFLKKISIDKIGRILG